ncbi:hypothetical protein EMCRGX_G011791 [Ephydatia muelleri]|eukprot:Em0006g654a
MKGYRRVAFVEEFWDILKKIHNSDGLHAGVKKTFAGSRVPTSSCQEVLLSSMSSCAQLVICASHKLQSLRSDLLITEILNDLPGQVQLVSGRPRYPQSQGVVEQAHYTSERMLSAKVAEQKTCKPRSMVKVAASYCL